MSLQEFKRALSYATVAMELLRRSAIPPYPQFYELLYTYATGVNPSLNARINAIFRDGPPDLNVAEALYEEFLKSNDQTERITNVSERMSARIGSMFGAIDAATANAEAYSSSLQAAADDLGVEISGEALRALAGKLLVETRQMQSTNRQLERKLQASREDIQQLQSDLDMARRESMLDPLTKLFNRKSLDDELARAIAAALEDGEPLSLLLLDIDHFKHFNDIYGHQTGDQVLRLVAMTLKSNIKGKDTAARYGGEEFVAVLPSVDLDGAIIIAENVRRAVQAKELLKRSTNEKLGRITASIGVAVLHPEDVPASFIERADRCLYAAKHAGRNRVVGETSLAGRDELMMPDAFTTAPVSAIRA